MKIRTILATLPLLSALCACQSDAPQEEVVSKPQFTVTALLPGSDDTRALIEYGYYDDPEKEVFKWTREDCISVFNVTKFEELHLKENAPILMIDMQKTVGIKAEFVSDPLTDEEAKRNELFFSTLKQGDLIFAILGACGSANLSEGAEGTTNLFSYFAGSNFYPQKIYENPLNESFSGLYHLHQMVRMYDIVKVEEDGKIPELHFKHLSALMRITLRNETGGPLFTKHTEINFTYPTGNDCSFIFGFSRISVEGNEENGFYLKENFMQPEKRHPLNPTPPDTITTLSYDCSHFINEPPAQVPLPSGKTYELYAVLSPRIGNQLKGDTLYIDLYDGVKSGYGKYDDCVKYPIKIPNFNIPIEPGKRYWFNLTATKDENGEPKLMFTNEWKKAHPEAQ